LSESGKCDNISNILQTAQDAKIIPFPLPQPYPLFVTYY